MHAQCYTMGANLAGCYDVATSRVGLCPNPVVLWVNTVGEGNGEGRI